MALVRYFLFEYCEWFFVFLSYSFHIPWHFNTLAQKLHFANWSFHFIKKYSHSAEFFIPTNSTNSQLELFEIKRLPQLIILLKWFFLDLLLSKNLLPSWKDPRCCQTRKLTKKRGKADQIRGTVNNNYYIGGRLYIMGSWATDSINFTKDLGTRISEATGEKRG